MRELCIAIRFCLSFWKESYWISFLSVVCNDVIFDGLPEGTRNKISILIYSKTKYTMGDLMPDEGFITYIRKYTEYKKSVRVRVLGKTAQFWMSYMDHVWLVLSFIRAVKSNYFSLYAKCLLFMADNFFSLDGENYAQYLTYFSVFVTNLDETHLEHLNFFKWARTCI